MGRRRSTHTYLPERVYYHHGAYWFVPPVGHKVRLGENWDAAAKQRWMVLSESQDGQATVARWLARFLDHRQSLVASGRLSERTYRDNLIEAKYLEAFFGRMHVVDVQPADVGLYLERRGSRAPVRANREKALLSSLFTWLLLRRDSGVTVNPCRGVRRIGEKPRERWIEDSEYAAVLKRARSSPRSIAPARAMELIYRTAQSPDDVLRITPRDIRTIDHEGRPTRVLRMRRMKTTNTVDILITPELDALLHECTGPVVHLDRPLISTRAGEPFTYDGIAAMFRRHVAACGLRDFGLRDLRAKAATDMYRAGIPLERIQVLLAHDSVTTTERYIKARLPGVAMPNQRIISDVSRDGDRDESRA